MVFLSQYEVQHNGRAVVLPAGFDLLRQQMNNILLVRGPRGSAGQLVKLENVLSVREVDDYVIDLERGQATITPGQTYTKTPAAIEQENKSRWPLILAGAVAIVILFKVVAR